MAGKPSSRNAKKHTYTQNVRFYRNFPTQTSSKYGYGRKTSLLFFENAKKTPNVCFKRNLQHKITAKTRKWQGSLLPAH